MEARQELTFRNEKDTHVLTSDPKDGFAGINVFTHRYVGSNGRVVTKSGAAAQNIHGIVTLLSEEANHGIF